MRYIVNDRPEAPSVDTIKFAMQMMDAPGAPIFDTKREKRLATVELAQQLRKSGKPEKKAVQDR